MFCRVSRNVAYLVPPRQRKSSVSNFHLFTDWCRQGRHFHSSLSSMTRVVPTIDDSPYQSVNTGLPFSPSFFEFCWLWFSPLLKFKGVWCYYDRNVLALQSYSAPCTSYYKDTLHWYYTLHRMLDWMHKLATATVSGRQYWSAECRALEQSVVNWLTIL